MKITVGKMLYVNVESVAIVDLFESRAPYCQLTGERQVVIDAECFEIGLKEKQFDEPPELCRIAGAIALKLDEEQADNINIYC